MLNGKRVVVVLPAYNAARTLYATVQELPEIVDQVILVDDASRDETVALARQLGLTVFAHERNRGYGGNQKTCYAQALAHEADVVVMLHPDYQYSPMLVTAMVSMIAYDVYDMALGSRILGGKAIAGGMPRYKYYANRILTLLQNLALGAKISEYHTGYRAFSRELLEALPIERYSDNFIFDNQVLADSLVSSVRVGEISCPARYFPEASSINFHRSVAYGLGVLQVSLRGLAVRWGFLPRPFRMKSSDSSAHELTPRKA